MPENQLQKPKLEKVTCRLLLDSIYNKLKGAIVAKKTYCKPIGLDWRLMVGQISNNIIANLFSSLLIYL